MLSSFMNTLFPFDKLNRAVQKISFLDSPSFIYHQKTTFYPSTSTIGNLSINCRNLSIHSKLLSINCQRLSIISAKLSINWAELSSFRDLRLTVLTRLYCWQSLNLSDSPIYSIQLSNHKVRPSSPFISQAILSTAYSTH